ncbi:MAG: photosynthetic complex assembly protein PuhC [Pseudomonadota bacterium]
MRNGLYLDAEARAIAGDKEIIPRRFMVAMVALAIGTVLLAAYSSLSGRPLAGMPPVAPIVAERTVTIEGDGRAILVTDQSGRVLLDVANGAFVSVVNDGLERARVVARVNGNPPVIITEYENGRMQLHDPASDWTIELGSFGAGNLRLFSPILAE